jgi:ABC-type transport system involved in cytochrome c biogenesis permease component
MSAPPSYRQRRRRRVRVIAAVLAFCLAAPPIIFAVQALRGFGAGITLLLGIAAGVAYFAFSVRHSHDDS